LGLIRNRKGYFSTPGNIKELAQQLVSTHRDPSHVSNLIAGLCRRGLTGECEVATYILVSDLSHEL
jgi:hypothetical protein